MRTVWLVQRGKINRPIDPKGRIGNALHLDYMGSAEFEFGALPSSLRDMQRHKNELKLKETSFKNLYGDTLVTLTYLDENDFEKWNGEFNEACAGKRSLKESLFMNAWINEIKAPATLKGKRAKDYVEARNGWRPEFWWDLNNGVMASFDKKFMNVLKDVLENSWKFMDENAAKKLAEKAA